MRLNRSSELGENNGKTQHVFKIKTENSDKCMKLDLLFFVQNRMLTALFKVVTKLFVIRKHREFESSLSATEKNKQHFQQIGVKQRMQRLSTEFCLMRYKWLCL